MDFFDPKGARITGPEWLDFYSRAYFLGGPKIGRRLNTTSPFVEDQVTALLQPGQPRTRDELKLIMAWKMGVIYHPRSEKERRIVYWPNWDKHLVRYTLHYEPSLTWLADYMTPILRHLEDGNPRSAFELIANERLVGFGPTYILTILFFLSGGRQPIYDRFAHIAAVAIFQGSAPDSVVHYRPAQTWDDYEGYKNLLVPIVRASGQTSETMAVPRSVDRALWVYGHLFDVQRAEQLGAARTDPMSCVEIEARQSSRATERDERRSLSRVAQEHYDVARSLDDERPGQMFTAAQFRQRYKKMFPGRNPTSIMPAGYAVPPMPSDEHYPKFLKKSDSGYVFAGPPRWLT